jgi:class 3 adenylate cyclase
VSAGFLGLHALATPGALLAEPNAGFVVATPVGLFLAACLAAASISPVAGPRAGWLLRHRGELRAAFVVLMVAWGAASLLRLRPLSGTLPAEEAVGPITALAIVAVPLFAVAAWRYFEISRRRHSPVALAIVAALLLLAEAMVAVALSRSWHLSWWEWHLLMTAAFAMIALGTRAEYRRTRSLVAAFEPIYLEATLARISRWHGRAIGELAAAEARGDSTERLMEDLRRDGATSEELTLLREAAREIRRVDELFRPYLPQDLAARLRREPDAGRLGGEERVVTVLFADLAGFTTFSEQHEPTEVVAMLNEFWAAVVPVIEDGHGAIEHFAGDGVLVLFNSVVDQPDHVVRAAGCARAILRATEPIATANPGWPRFRIGLNTGPAVVGNVGAAGRRSFASIGDTTNLGARLMSAGAAGEIVMGATTHAALAPQIAAGQLAVRALGAVRVKGKREPVEAWVLEG